MKYSSDYDHDPAHWRFARTLPRQPFKPQRRYSLGDWLLLAAALTFASLLFRMLP